MSDTANPAGRAGQPPAGRLLRRAGLSALITIVSLNVWTGSPLLALWIGSRVQGSGPPSMTAVGVLVVVLAVFSYLLVRLLTALGAAHDRLTGATPTVRTHAPWLRSMRGEREEYRDSGPSTTTFLERTLVVMVVVAFTAFEIWFFFFSSSPIDGRSGRSALPGDGSTALARYSPPPHVLEGSGRQPG